MIIWFISDKGLHYVHVIKRIGKLRDSQIFHFWLSIGVFPQPNFHSVMKRVLNINWRANVYFFGPILDFH